MSDYDRLAALLEHAAKALREAGAALAQVQTIRGWCGDERAPSLSARAQKTLAKLGIASWEALSGTSADDLLGCKNCGITTVNEIREVLRRRGLYLRGETIGEKQWIDEQFDREQKPPR
jgi:hypothetical protein